MAYHKYQRLDSGDIYHEKERDRSCEEAVKPQSIRDPIISQSNFFILPLIVRRALNSTLGGSERIAEGAYHNIIVYRRVGT